MQIRYASRRGTLSRSSRPSTHTTAVYMHDNAAVTDWFDWYSMADMNTWAGYGLGGSPWPNNDNEMNYWRPSSMGHALKASVPC